MTPETIDTTKEYRQTLAHVIRWIEGDGGFDMMKPLNAEYANGIAQICRGVLLEELTLQDSISKYAPSYEGR